MMKNLKDIISERLVLSKNKKPTESKNEIINNAQQKLKKSKKFKKEQKELLQF